MQMQTVLRRMEEYVQDFREQMKKKDADSITALTSNMKEFFTKLEGELPANVDLGPHFATMTDCAKRFGAACSQNDMQGAAKALSDMELAVKTLENQCAMPA